MEDLESRSAIASAESRFMKLLRPYRELADDWNVDIAEELLDYIKNELGDVESGHGLNFAQAAVLVQNSAIVYTKKVESLYMVILEALERLSTHPGKEISKKGLDRARKLESSEGDSEVEEGDMDDDDVENDDDLDDLFLLLPLKPVNERFSTLVEPTEISSLAPSVPIDLLASSRTGLTVLRSALVNFITGAFSLDGDAEIIPDTVQFTSIMVGDQSVPSSNDISIAQLDYEDGPDFGGDDEYYEEENGQKLEFREDGRKATTAQISFSSYLDANIPCKKRVEKAFRKGRCFTNPADDKAEDFDFMARNHRSGTKLANAPLISILIDAHGSSSYHATSLLSVAFPEFETLYKLRQKTLRKLDRSGFSHDEAAEDDEGLNDEADGFEDDNHFDAGDDANYSTGDGSDSNYLNLPNIALEQPPDTYADLVRSHVSRFIETARNWASETKLSLRVRGWHEHLEPILAEQEDRPAFDLREYETIVVGELQTMQKDRRALIAFEEIVDKAELLKSIPQKSDFSSNQLQISKWQVCRLFLTTLELANQGSLAIDDSLGRGCDSETQFAHRQSENFAVTYMRPARQTFSKVNGKKKMMRLSDAENEHPNSASI